MIIYLLQNNINNKIYIGKTINSLSLRFKEHCQSASRGSTQLLHRAIRKYRKDNFYKIILAKTDDIKELDVLEIYFIKKYHALVNEGGYNVTKGGTGGATRIGMKSSEETKLKMSIAHKGIGKGIKRKPHSLETKLKLSISNKGKSHIKGHKLSMEQRQKISERMKGNKHGLGKTHSEEYRKVLSLWMKINRDKMNGFKGFHHSEETKQKLRKANLGKKHTEEQKQKIGSSVHKYHLNKKHENSILSK